jgi:hypothetical protein
MSLLMPESVTIRFGHQYVDSALTQQRTVPATVPLLMNMHLLWQSRNLVAMELCLQGHCLAMDISSGYEILALNPVTILTQSTKTYKMMCVW